MLINYLTVQSFTKYDHKISSKDIISENVVDENIIESKTTVIQKNGEYSKEILNWYIEIPSIFLKAPIGESTNMDVLNEFVGHFEETSKTTGNIGLAGHNRGYKNNYFENLNKIQKGDEIKYRYNEFEKTYLVENIEKIKSTNWDYLENSEINKLTLITCIEDAPDYRLCIQATEKQ